ncbi:MAG TPA: tetratricopeptide repeat protein [Geminicoccaceae bacterium]|jgi:Flp pilus assembly protein TadD|nr:tetratricopeptide repeat protein [Geminicoccaceae bacterium]
MIHLLSLTRRPFRRARLGAALLVLAVVACGAQSSPTSSRLAGLAATGLPAMSDASFNTAPGDYLAGNFAVDSGHLAEAADYFGRALAAEPNNLDLLRQLFLLSLASGRYDAALEQARQLADRDREADEARLLLALEQARGGHFQAARAPLKELGSEGIAGLTAPFLDAWAIFGAGGQNATDNAIARLGQGEALGPLNGYHKAMMLDLGGRLDAAVGALKEAMPDNGPAPVRIVQAYASVLARHGERAKATDAVRQQMADGRELPILVDLLTTLEAGGSPAPPFNDAAGGMADALLGVAEALHQERGNSRAIVYARLAMFLKSDLAEAALLIADILSEQENSDGAIAAYQAVEDTSPLAYTAKLRMARTLHSLNRKEESFQLLEQLAQAYPERTEALVEFADLARSDEDYARAETAYSRAIERIKTPQPEDWSLFYARGITYERTKRWPQAEADFLHALKLQPEQPYVLNYLGYSWVDQGINLDRAKGMLNRAVELRPNDGYIVDSLGWVDFRLGDYNGAVDRLERAVELEPGDPTINDHLGDAYWRVGREREARFQWRRALSLNPDRDAVADIEQKLRSGLSERERNRS